MVEVTNVLIELLEKVSRRRLARALELADDPETALVEGHITKQLGLSSQPSRATKHRTPADDINVAQLFLANTDQLSKPLSGRANYAVVNIYELAYPNWLKEIPDPPLVLYCVGNLSLMNKTCVSVVGARRCTSMGIEFAQHLATELADADVIVVSGLALGIDGAAHKGVLASTQPSHTIAVLGAGFNHMYPAAHKPLAQKIVTSGGLILSEWPASRKVQAFQFPERNRIISGLSCATVVVEAGAKSGSLITARLALEQGRDVLAVPGPIGREVSRGCHRLIQQGAGLVTSAQDVFESLAIVPGVSLKETQIKLDAQQQKIIDQFHGEAVIFDELVVHTGLAPHELAQQLVVLELAGIVEQGTLGYIRTSKFSNEE